MPPTSPQCTLVGFSPELDWRPLSFLKPIPANLVCSACILVRRRTAHLPCMHTLCECCYGQCTKDGSLECPLDRSAYEEDDVTLMDFSADDLLKRESCLARIRSPPCAPTWTSCLLIPSGTEAYVSWS
ncbi:uncharacterized protein LOC144104385 isoform X2 [Amblyomma americanum]